MWYLARTEEKPKSSSSKNQQKRYGYVWVKKALGLWLLAFSQTKTKAHSRGRLLLHNFIYLDTQIKRHRQECLWIAVIARNRRDRKSKESNSGATGAWLSIQEKTHDEAGDQ